MSKPVCVILGIGPKNGAAFARRFHGAGYRVAMLSRSTNRSTELASELGPEDAKPYACDASQPAAIQSTFEKVRAELGDPDVLVYNAGSGVFKKFDETTPEDLERSFRINALGLLSASQAVLPAMRRRRRGCIVVVGATASLRGKPITTAFAAAKAAQRSLAQSMARQFGPEGVHVGLLIVDGRIGEAGGASSKEAPTELDPLAIAEAALMLTAQPSSAWTFELDLRPQTESW
jgi:NAD(P)-dependent dehydrogenase (short-subunit alcohol dehydrogenase family)